MARGEHPPACARQWRERAAAEAWPSWQTVQAIHGCCGVTLLKAHRLARGWTARVAIGQLRELCEAERLGKPLANIDLLNVWENNRARPRPDAQDQLARLYKANAVRLGLATDYCDDEHRNTQIVVPHQAPDLPVIAPAAVCQPRQSGQRDDGAIGSDALFHHVLSGPGPAATGRLLAEVERLRQQMDRTLAAGTVTEDQMDRLDETVHGYRADYITAPPLPMLCTLMLEFAGVRNLAAHRQPASIQRRLSHVAATLAVLSADALMKIGDTRQSRAWYGTARTAADDTADPRLRALVRAQEAMLPYYYGDLADAVRLAREAQAIARGIPCSPTALAAAAEARALARLGDYEAAAKAVITAQEIFSRIGGGSGLAFDFSEQRLHLYLSGIYAYLPDARRAALVQERALSLHPPGDVTLDPALIRLDRATSLARSGEISDACQLAETTLVGLEPHHRTSIVFVRARDVRAAIPASRDATRLVQRLSELLSLEKAAP